MPTPTRIRVFYYILLSASYRVSEPFAGIRKVAFLPSAVLITVRTYQRRCFRFIAKAPRNKAYVIFIHKIKPFISGGIINSAVTACIAYAAFTHEYWNTRIPCVNKLAAQIPFMRRCIKMKHIHHIIVIYSVSYNIVNILRPCICSHKYNSILIILTYRAYNLIGIRSYIIIPVYPVRFVADFINNIIITRIFCRHFLFVCGLLSLRICQSIITYIPSDVA